MQPSDSKGAELKCNKKEDILLDALIRYVLPSFGKGASKNKKKQSRLEELVKKEKPGLKPLELIFLEDLISSFLKNNSSNKIKIKKTESMEFPELEIDNKNNDEEEIRYSIAFERKKEEKDKLGYSVSITYEETEIEERLSIKIHFDNNTLDKYPSNKKTIKDNENNYFITIKKEKNNQSRTKDNYSIKLVYENNYEKERLSVDYISTIGAYLNRRQDALHNFEDRVPGKHVDIFPASAMPGVLGFTYLGQDRMALRDDLSGDLKRMVDIHESIHTPDEYETRLLTDWIMAKPKMKYIK